MTICRLFDEGRNVERQEYWAACKRENSDFSRTKNVGSGKTPRIVAIVSVVDDAVEVDRSTLAKPDLADR
jgi:hypothetical protein